MGRLERAAFVLVAAAAVAAVAYFGSLRKNDSGRARSAAPSTTSAGTQGPSTTVLPEDVVAETDYEIGDCVLLNRETSNLDPQIIDCADPHTIEISGHVTVADVPAFPTQAEWVFLTADCAPQARQILGAPVERTPFIGGIIHVPEELWRLGQRDAWCYLAMRGGERLSEASDYTGRAVDIVQAG
jgi:hypothetical protein